MSGKRLSVAVGICIVALMIAGGLIVRSQLSRACPSTGEVLRRDLIVERAITWVLERDSARDGALRYENADDVLRQNENCCQIVDPSENAATEPAYSMPSRTGLISQIVVAHYTIVDVRIAAVATTTDRYFQGAVAVGKCGEILSWSNGSISDR